MGRQSCYELKKKTKQTNKYNNNNKTKQNKKKKLSDATNPLGILSGITFRKYSVVSRPISTKDFDFTRVSKISHEL